MLEHLAHSFEVEIAAMIVLVLMLVAISTRLMFMRRARRIRPEHLELPLLDKLLNQARDKKWAPFWMSRCCVKFSFLNSARRLLSPLTCGLIVGDKQFLVVSHPLDIAMVLSSKSEKFPKEPLLYDEVIGGLLLGRSGLLARPFSNSDYMQSRKILAVAFHKSMFMRGETNTSSSLNFEDVSRKILKHATKLKNLWASMISGCTVTFTPHRDVSETLLAFLCDFASFQPPTGIETNLCDVAQAFRRLTADASAKYRALSGLSCDVSDHDSSTDEMIVSSRNLINQFAAGIVDGCFDDGGLSCDSLLATIQCASKAEVDRDCHDHSQASNESRNALVRSHMIDHVKTFLFAGFDTTANALLWTLKHLSENPDIQTELAESLANIETMNEACAAADLQYRAPFLRAVIQESLRLHPPAPILYRSVAAGETHLTFPSSPFRSIPISSDKTALVLNLYAAHRCPDTFNSSKHGPDAFHPRRWLTSDGSFGPPHGHGSAYFPFSLGTRSCIGKDLANMELEYFVAVLVSHFCFAPVRRSVLHQPRESLVITLSPDDRFRLAIRLRHEEVNC